MELTLKSIVTPFKEWQQDRCKKSLHIFEDNRLKGVCIRKCMNKNCNKLIKS